MKGLCWDRNGFILFYKRLDGAGARYKWPKNPAAVRDITASQLSMLLEGLSVDPPKGFGDITARVLN